MLFNLFYLFFYLLWGLVAFFQVLVHLGALSTILIEVLHLNIVQYGLSELFSNFLRLFSHLGMTLLPIFSSLLNHFSFNVFKFQINYNIN